MTKNTENQSPELLALQDAQAPAAPSDDTRDLVEAAVARMRNPAPEQPEQETPEQPAKAPQNPFNSWKKEAQAELAKLPPHIQQFIKDRETQFHKGVEQYKSESQFARRMEKVLSSHAAFIKEQGSTPEEAIGTLLHTEKTLRTGSPEARTAMLQQLAHAYGIDLRQAAAQPFDPRLNTLEQQNQRLNSQIEHHRAAQQQAKDSLIEFAFHDYAQTHEHFNAVRKTMSALLNQGLAKDLDEAYAKAVRLDDGVFGKVQAKQLEAAKRAQIQQANQAAKAAKAANVSVRGAPTGVTHAKPADTTEEQVRQNMKALGLYN